ncbi:hypothetical protein Tco_0656278 [Tanacetum coccineum]|uniref:Ty3-gypsy retrotransposon protein n=1 Tax=Tanacetum coccineum TaxID=301880 RepID=A0ABQ4X8B6_9ASTR
MAVDVTALIEQMIAIELELEKIESLKAQLRSKEPCFTSDYVKPKVLAPGMYAIDVKPIPHPLKNNRRIERNRSGNQKGKCLDKKFNKSNSDREHQKANCQRLQKYKKLHVVFYGLECGLEVGSIRRIQGIGYGILEFLIVGTTFDIFQNIHILYLEYGVLVFSGYSVLSLFPLWSLVSVGTDMPYLP